MYYVFNMRNEINIWENATTTQLHDHLTENNFTADCIKVGTRLTRKNLSKTTVTPTYQMSTIYIDENSGSDKTGVTLEDISPWHRLSILMAKESHSEFAKVPIQNTRNRSLKKAKKNYLILRARKLFSRRIRPYRKPRRYAVMFKIVCSVAY